MNEPVKSPLDEKRQRLLEKSLGSILAWQVPQIEYTVGPHDPTAFDAWDARRAEAIRACRDKLKEYLDAEIMILLGKSEGEDDTLARDWRGHVRNALRIYENPPYCYAGGFGHPDHVADFTHWAKMSSFSVEELLCLSIGIEPSNFSEKKLRELAKRDQSHLHPALQFMLRRYELLKREFLYYGHPPVEIFIKWADRVEFPMHPEFLRLLRMFHQGGKGQSGNEQDSPDKPFDKRAINSIAKLITAMAINGYGYDPDAKHSKIPKELADVIAEMGSSLTESTVRTYLKLGANILKQDREGK